MGRVIVKWFLLVLWLYWVLDWWLDRTLTVPIMVFVTWVISNVHSFICVYISCISQSHLGYLFFHWNCNKVPSKWSFKKYCIVIVENNPLRIFSGIMLSNIVSSETLLLPSKNFVVCPLISPICSCSRLWKTCLPLYISVYRTFWLRDFMTLS